MHSVRRGLAVMSSGALVVGAGAAVGVMAADMSGQWSEQAALKAAADQVVEDPGNDDPIRRAVIVTRIKERHVTPKPVVVHRKVYVRVPSGQGVPRTQAPRAKAAPQRQTVRSAPKPRPSRKVVAPAPAAPKPAASAPKAKSKTS
jgi:hypothetical protein